MNPLVSLALKSPLHFLFSDNILLLTFTGRASGSIYTTPLRYTREDGAVRCFTSQRTRWWRSIVQNAAVKVRIAGETKNCKATAIFNEPQTLHPALEAYLRRFPQDAVYHSVRLNRDGTPVSADLDRAAGRAVLILIDTDLRDG